jgi:hypothetical protein
LLKPHNLTDDSFTAIAEFDTFFVGESEECEGSKKWFHIDVLGIEQDEPEDDWIETDAALIDSIQRLSPTDLLLSKLLSTSSAALNDGMQVVYGVVYRNGRIKVPDNEALRVAILKSRHDS